MPPPPPGFLAPVMWGTEEHVRSLFEGSGAELSFERRTVTFTADSPEAWVDYQEASLGPVIMARAALEPLGRWESLRAEILELNREGNEATDGSFGAPAEYLLSIARMPA
jgi:hypothetical protein